MEIMNVANDLGYGFVKADVDGQQVYMPSVIAAKQTYLAPNPATVTDNYMDTFLTKMDATVNSVAVKRNGRYLIGEAATEGSSRKQTFNIYSGIGKSADDLSLILTLTMIAGVKVQRAYQAGKDIFAPLTASVRMSTALPIAEGRDVRVLEQYESLFKDHKHTVTFNNFADPITVTITFEEVAAFLEGEVASVALVNAATGMEGFPELDSLRETVQADYQTNYSDRAKKYGVDEVLQAQNTLIIDAGEGTGDFVVATDGVANPALTDSIPLGYGTALENTRQEARVRGIGDFKSRYELKTYLSRKLSGANAEKQAMVKEILNEQLQVVADGLADEASDILTNVANDLDVIFVLGGSSIPLAEATTMREQLVGLVTSMNATSPVIWIDRQYAQVLNELGLKLALTAM